jgi:hypothetical protein
MKKKLIYLAAALLFFSFGFISMAKAVSSTATNPLRIGNVRTDKVSTKNVTIKWDTSKTAYSKIYISTSHPVNTSGTPIYASASSTTSFSTVLQNLATSTKYYYKIFASTDNTYASSTSASKEGYFRTQSKFINLNCASTAVITRDDAIILSLTTFHNTTKIALETRREALKVAWLIEDNKTRREEIKKAWNIYTTTVKNARKTYNDTKKNIWKNFKKAKNDCKANTNDDPGSENFDSSL